MSNRRMIVIALGLAAASAVAFAAPKGKEIGEPAVVQHLLDCRKLAGDAERLACYDKAAAAMESATASGDLVSIDREQRRAARRQAFGFILPTLSFLERGDKEGEADHITATIAEVSEDPYGKLVIKLDDGAVWTETEPEPLGRRPHKGSNVTISKGMMGGFFMTIDGQGAGKAKRIG
jgi:hypothetical protein